MVKSGDPAAFDPLLSGMRAVPSGSSANVRYRGTLKPFAQQNRTPFSGVRSDPRPQRNLLSEDRRGKEMPARSGYLFFLELLEERWGKRSPWRDYPKRSGGILSDRELVGEYLPPLNLLISSGTNSSRSGVPPERGLLHLHLKSGTGSRSSRANRWTRIPVASPRGTGKLVELSQGAPPPPCSPPCHKRRQMGTGSASRYLTATLPTVCFMNRRTLLHGFPEDAIFRNPVPRPSDDPAAAARPAG